MSQAGPPESNGPEIDPIIDALLDHLPTPGEYFAKEDRKRWLQIVEMVFDLIYDDQPQPEPSEGTATHGGANV